MPNSYTDHPSSSTGQNSTFQPNILYHLMPSHFSKPIFNKYEPHSDNGILRYLADCSTANMVAWIPGRHTVLTINKCTIIKASSSDFEFIPNTIITASHIPDILTLPPPSPQGCKNISSSKLTESRGSSHCFSKPKIMQDEANLHHDQLLMNSC